MKYSDWFTLATKDGQHPGHENPWVWQAALSAEPDIVDRLIRIPTGFGKTQGVLGAFLYNRVVQESPDWPRRLVWCLPMRSLVDQTTAEAEKMVANAGLSNRVEVHTLMGGQTSRDWTQHPEKEAILVGTQDMLISRALNRGYASGRAAWPVEFGLINSDALWVMDEVQLMGVTLATSAQIQAFWRERHPGTSDIPPRKVWWMSATLQPNWLVSPETTSWLPKLEEDILELGSKDHAGPAWKAKKHLELKTIDLKKDALSAQQIAEQHLSHKADLKLGRQTLVVLNKVSTARDLHSALDKHFAKDPEPPEIELIHSRFRPADRAGWKERFLAKEKLGPNTNRIIVATQVVEAGVDISSSCLVTQICPWSSLVQRAGRAARYGGEAVVVVLDDQPQDDKAARPYAHAELEATREALSRLEDLSISSIVELEQTLRDQNVELLQRLYPYEPLHVLQKQEFEELFDTSPDLSGSDIDVSRFIREGDDRDVQVFWRDLDIENPNAAPPETLQKPARDELCRVPIGEAIAWLGRLKGKKIRAWTWNYLDGAWLRADRNPVRPGMVLLVPCTAGGYNPHLGFHGKAANKKTPVRPVDLGEQAGTATTSGQGSDKEDGTDSSTAASWKTIYTHCREAGETMEEIANQLGLEGDLSNLLKLCLRLHDWGKAHPAFAEGTYGVEPVRYDLAKAPKGAWRAPKSCYKTESHGHRKGFRHELATVLALFELLSRRDAEHPALRGSVAAVLDAIGMDAPPVNPIPDPNVILDEVQALDADQFNLLAYLLAAHHGKVRASLQASPKDQEFPSRITSLHGSGMPIRGVRQDDLVPATTLPAADGRPVAMPEARLRLDLASLGLSAAFGPSWSERALGLIRKFGPFKLSYYEALVRTADVRASQLETEDHELKGQNLEIPTYPASTDAKEAAHV